MHRMDTTMTRGAVDAASTSAESAPRSPAPRRNSGDRPPGERGRWGGLSLLADMKRDYLGFAEARHRRHGDICTMRIVQERAYDLFSPELVREALVDHADALVRWERGVEVFAQLFGQGVLTTEGATWQRQRRMLMPAFSPKRVAGYAGLMGEAAASALERALPAGAVTGEVGMDALFSRVAMDVILRTLFGQQLEGEAEAAIEATRVMGETGMREMFFPITLPDWLPLPGKVAKRRAMRTLRGLVGGHIQRRRALPDAAQGNDLLSRLLALRDEETGEALSEQELFDQCIVSFQAGHETTATALLWWSRLLAAHPQAAARAGEEVDAVLAGRVPGAEDAAALPFLTATLKEAMRLYPPIAALMTRRTTREITVGGWTIAAGTLLYVTPWVLHRDRRWWPQPSEFRPERFLPGAPEVPRGAYIPFGVGPRVCLGQHFAMLEMVIVAAMLLQRYEMELLPGAVELEPVLNVTLRPKGGVRLKLRRRY
jgi:cytochrome P450